MGHGRNFTFWTTLYNLLLTPTCIHDRRHTSMHETVEVRGGVHREPVNLYTGYWTLHILKETNMHFSITFG